MGKREIGEERESREEREKERESGEEREREYAIYFSEETLITLSSRSARDVFLVSSLCVSYEI